MSSSTPSLRFLLDENVQVVLAKTLSAGGLDIKLAPKSVSDSALAALSKKERRILITHDEDFEWYTKDQLFSVILLRIPQNNSSGLVESFQKLLSEFKNFPGRIVILRAGGWEDFPLWERFPAAKKPNRR